MLLGDGVGVFGMGTNLSLGRREGGGFGSRMMLKPGSGDSVISLGLISSPLHADSMLDISRLDHVPSRLRCIQTLHQAGLWKTNQRDKRWYELAFPYPNALVSTTASEESAVIRIRNTLAFTLVTLERRDAFPFFGTRDLILLVGICILYIPYLVPTCEHTFISSFLLILIPIVDFFPNPHSRIERSSSEILPSRVPRYTPHRPFVCGLDAIQ